MDWYWVCLFIHFMDSYRWKRYVYEGHVAEEEVYGSVEVRVQRDGWWACSPAPCSGTFPGTGQITHPAPLAGWGYPKRMNLDMQLWFSLLMLPFTLLGIKRNQKFLELRITEHSSYYVVIWFLRVTLLVYRQISLHCTHTDATSSLVRAMQLDLSEPWHIHVKKVYDFNQTLLWK